MSSVAFFLQYVVLTKPSLCGPTSISLFPHSTTYNHNGRPTLDLDATDTIASIIQRTIYLDLQRSIILLRISSRLDPSHILGLACCLPDDEKHPWTRPYDTLSTSTSCLPQTTTPRLTLHRETHVGPTCDSRSWNCHLCLTLYSSSCNQHSEGD